MAFYDLESGVAFAPAEDGVKLQPGSAVLIRGTLRLEVLATRHDAVEIAATLAPAQALREGQPDPAMKAMLESTPCLLHLHDDGSIEDTTFAPDVPEDDRNFVRLACAWEFCLRPETTWSKDEAIPESTGVFRANYFALPDGTVKKSRAFVPGSEDSGSQRVVFSELIARPGALWLDTLVGRETTEMLLDGKPIARALVHIRLTRLDAAPAWTAPDTQSFDTFTTRPEDARESVDARLAREQLARIYAAIPLDTMTAKLDAVREKTMHEKLPAMRELSDWLRVHGREGAAQIAAAVQAGALDEDTAGMAIHSVGNARETEAISTLLETPESLAPGALLQAIVEAGGSPQANERIVKALFEIAGKQFPPTPDGEDFRPNDAALYALGRLAEKDAALRTRVEKSLLPSFDESADPALSEVALRALANARSGSPEVLAAATAVLTSPGHDQSTRVAALGLLGQSSTPLPPDAVEAATAALAPAQASDMQLAALDVFAEHPEGRNATASERIRELGRSANSSVAAAAQKASARLAR